MVSKLRSRVALGFAIVGVLITLGTVVLPSIKTHQIAIATGPASPYGATPTTLSGYLIPTVDRGSLISIVITGYSPKSMSFSLFPADPGSLAPNGPTLLFLNNFTGPITKLNIVSPDTQAYGIYIASSNRTQFVIAVAGIWSPYFALRQYTPEGLFIALGGFLAYYYFRHFELRRSIEEKAAADLKEEKAKSETPGTFVPEMKANSPQRAER